MEFAKKIESDVALGIVQKKTLIGPCEVEDPEPTL